MENILGSGQFGIVKQGVLFRGTNDSVVDVVDAKTSKGIKFTVI